MKLFWLQFLWNAEGGGGAAAGGGAGGGDAPAGGSDAPAGGSSAPVTPLAKAAADALAEPGPGKGDIATPGGEKTTPEDQEGIKPYFPDGLPPELRGANERETLDKIAQEYATRAKPPEKADGYKLDGLPQEFVEKWGDLADDPVVPMWREVALEIGLTNAQFQDAIPKLYAKLAEAKMLDDPVNVEAELMKLAPSSGDPVSKKTSAARRFNAALSGVDGLVERQVLTPEQGATLSRLAETATGVQVIERLLGDGAGLRPGGSGARGDTKEGLIKLMQDPRYQVREPQGDVKFAEDVDRRWRALHGALPGARATR